jgi:hypothetical protein
VLNNYLQIYDGKKTGVKMPVHELLLSPGESGFNRISDSMANKGFQGSCGALRFHVFYISDLPCRSVLAQIIFNRPQDAISRPNLKTQTVIAQQDKGIYEEFDLSFIYQTDDDSL